MLGGGPSTDDDIDECEWDEDDGGDECAEEAEDVADFAAEEGEDVADDPADGACDGDDEADGEADDEGEGEDAEYDGEDGVDAEAEAAGLREDGVEELAGQGRVGCGEGEDGIRHRVLPFLGHGLRVSPVEASGEPLGLIEFAELDLAVVDVSDGFVEHGVRRGAGIFGPAGIGFGIEVDSLSRGFVAFFGGEGVGGDDFAEADAEEFADLGESAADGGLAGAEGLGDFLAGLAVEDAHSVDGEIEEVALFLGEVDGHFDLGAEDGGFVFGVYAAAWGDAHPGLVELGGAFVSAAFLGAAAVHFVAQDVLGDGEEPGGETGAAGGVVAVDGFGECGEGFLGEVLDGLGADAAFAPLEELGADDGAEGLPELKPGRLVVVFEAGDEVGGEV